MVLPLSEVVLRRFFNTGVPGARRSPRTSRSSSDSSARRSRRAKASCSRSPPARCCRRAVRGTSPEYSPRSSARWSRRSSRSAACVSSRCTTRRAKEIALGVPIWVADLAFPVAFGLIALRLVWKSSPAMIGRALAALGIAAGAWISSHRKCCSISRPGRGLRCSSAPRFSACRSTR